MKRLLALLLCAALLIPACAVTAESETKQTAVECALDYLDALYLSREGLIAQLVYEGYTEDESVATVDSLPVDWFDQAAGSAMDYLEYDSYSELELAQLLLNVGYSPEEAKYGAASALGRAVNKPEQPETPAVPVQTPVPEGIPILLTTPVPSTAPADEPVPTEGELAALEDAKAYTKEYWFSRQDLYATLISDGYTGAEAQYGADHVGVNWFTEAAGLAKKVLDGWCLDEDGNVDESIEPLTREGLESYMSMEGFTEDEVDYAVAVAFGDQVDLPSVTPTPEPLPSEEHIRELLGALPSATPAPTEPEYTPVPDWNSWGQTPTIEVSTPTPEPAVPTPVPAQVTIQSSWLTTQELIAMRKQVNDEIHSRPEWKEVEVPTGTWTVGTDIPAGTYSIRGLSESFFGTVYIYPKDSEYFDDYYSIGEGNVIGKVVLQDGDRVQNTGAVIFAPPETPVIH